MAEIFQVSLDWKVSDFGPVIREAVDDTAKVIRERSRQDIGGHIRHPGRFVKGLTTSVQHIRGGYVIQVIQRPSFSKVFEFGGTSIGKPLLWLPVPPNRFKLRKYAGKLIRPKGSRVLLSVRSKVKIRGMAGTGQGGSEVKYVGVASITNRPRLHLRQIALEEANRLSEKIVRFAAAARSR